MCFGAASCGMPVVFVAVVYLPLVLFLVTVRASSHNRSVRNIFARFECMPLSIFLARIGFLYRQAVFPCSFLVCVVPSRVVVVGIVEAGLSIVSYYVLIPRVGSVLEVLSEYVRFVLVGGFSVVGEIST